MIVTQARNLFPEEVEARARAKKAVREAEREAAEREATDHVAAEQEASER